MAIKFNLDSALGKQSDQATSFPTPSPSGNSLLKKVKFNIDSIVHKKVPPPADAATHYLNPLNPDYEQQKNAPMPETSMWKNVFSKDTYSLDRIGPQIDKLANTTNKYVRDPLLAAGGFVGSAIEATEKAFQVPTGVLTGHQTIKEAYFNAKTIGRMMRDLEAMNTGPRYKGSLLEIYANEKHGIPNVPIEETPQQREQRLNNTEMITNAFVDTMFSIALGGEIAAPTPKTLEITPQMAQNALKNPDFIPTPEVKAALEDVAKGTTNLKLTGTQSPGMWQEIIGKYVLGGNPEKPTTSLEATPKPQPGSLAELGGNSRPASQIALEDALNAGDLAKAHKIVDAIPKDDPYKASMESLLAREGGFPKTTGPSMPVAPPTAGINAVPTFEVPKPVSVTPRGGGEPVDITPITFHQGPQAVFEQNPLLAEMENFKDEVLQELQGAKAGRRIPVRDADGYITDVISDPSTFPDFIPENLRKSSIVKPVVDHIENGTLPTTPNQIELYKIVAERMGITEPVKDIFTQVNNAVDSLDEKQAIAEINNIIKQAEEEANAIKSTDESAKLNFDIAKAKALVSRVAANPEIKSEATPVPDVKQAEIQSQEPVSIQGGQANEPAASVTPPLSEPKGQILPTEPTGAPAAEPEKSSVTLTAVPIPGLREFVEQDLKPFIEASGSGFIDSVRLLAHVVSPPSGVKSDTLDKVMKMLGERNRLDFVLGETTKSIDKIFNAMSKEEQITFIDRMKQGIEQPTKELQAIADMMREIDTNNWKLAAEFNPTIAWKENHFRVLWKKIPGQDVEKSFLRFFSKRPLQGTRGFLRHSTLDTMSEGIAKGGIPYSYNPMVMFRIAQSDIQKYITAQRMWAGLDKTLIKHGEIVPEGKARIDDRIAKMYFSFVDDGQPRVGGGDYYVDEGDARILNNFLSHDYIREVAAGRSLFWVKNATTAVELSLSPFHAIFETIEASGSSIGLGLQKIFNQGKVVAGVKDILTAPFASYLDSKLGGAAIRFVTKGDIANDKGMQKFLKQYPEADQLIEDLFAGGAKLKMHEDYRNNTVQTFKENVGSGNYIGGALRALPALNDTIMKPLFDIFIPRVKIGRFLREYSNALAENSDALEAGEMTRGTLARKTWAFVEDRFGEMNFDNLFWNRTFKSAMQLMFRSVTWKWGNLRASGGAFFGQAKEFYDAAREMRAPRLTPKMAWFLGMTIATATVATIVQYASIQEYPKDLKDLVFPRIDKKGRRVSTPSYWRDLLSLKAGPGKYVVHGLSGFIGKIVEDWQNRDYYGNQIYSPYDPMWKKFTKAGINFIPKPFSIQSALNSEGKDKIYGYFGFTKAPAYVTNTKVQNSIYDLYNKRFGGGIKSELQSERSDIYKKYRALLDAGDKEEAKTLKNQAIKDKIATERGFDQVSNGQPADVYMFNRLPQDDKDHLIKMMTDDEKKYYKVKTKK